MSLCLFKKLCSLKAIYWISRTSYPLMCFAETGKDYCDFCSCQFSWFVWVLKARNRYFTYRVVLHLQTWSEHFTQRLIKLEFALISLKVIQNATRFMTGVYLLSHVSRLVTYLNILKDKSMSTHGNYQITSFWEWIKLHSNDFSS